MRFAFLLLVLVAGLRAGEPLTVATAIERAGATLAVNAEGALVFEVKNRTESELAIAQPAGLIAKAAQGETRMITLRSVEAKVAPRSTLEAVIPAAILRGPAVAGAFAPTRETEPRLAALLGYLGKRDDLPQATAQLLVACLLDDVGFAAWRQKFSQTPAAEPAPQEIVTAIDALGILRQLAPDRTPALALDHELKLRALRNPVARAKAVQLFGLDSPAAPLPPELGSLLHTKPGDNCPICRQRALMQQREDGL